MRLAVLALVLAGCMDTAAAPPTWPPPPGTALAECGSFPIADGAACADAGWCSDCYQLQGCYCDGTAYSCVQLDSVCDFGEGAGCPIEGTPGCGIPPAPGYATCTGGHVEITHTCPFPECPTYDPATSSCM